MADGTFTQEQVEALLAERLAQETAGLKKNQQELLKEAKAAKERLAAFDGVDPEEFKKLKSAAEEAERKRLAGEADFKKLEQQLLQKLEGERGTWQSREKQLLGALDEHLLDAAAALELAKHSESPDLLLPHVRRQMKLIEQDGKFAARVVDESGTVRIGKGQGSAPMTLSELMEEMKQDKRYALAFKGTGSSGGGATKPTGGAGGSKTVAANDSNAFFANLKGIAKGEIEVVGG